MNYKNPFNKSAIALAVSSATILAGSFGGVAYAQEDDTNLEEVVVTGSRIKRADLSSVTPVSVVTGEEFVISGNLNIEQKLAELPQTLPSFGPSSNNPGDGTARVDLRGLGDTRTLVLVNGRRYIPATQTGVVDLNSIPGTLIKQVDVTTGGASAVYGSDALAGVVNFQLIDDFQGVEITGLYDVTDEGDGDKINLDITIGGNFDDGRGNAVLYASYSERDAVFSDARDFSNVVLQEGTDANGNNALVPGGSSGIPGSRNFFAATLPNGQNLGFFEQDGSGRAFQDPADRFNFAPDNFLQLPQERFLLSSFAHYDLTENTRLYSELTFSRNEVPQELAPTPAFAPVFVNPESPFFAPDVQFALDGRRTATASDTNGDGVVNGDDNVDLYIGRRLVENGSRQVIDTRDAYRILLGVDGEINDNWSFDAYYSRSTLDNSNLLEGDVNRSRFLQALLVTDDGTACQDPSNGCVPLNIFGAGNISQEAIDFIQVGATNVTSITQQVAQASVSGLLGTIPGANEQIGVVVGLEYRQDDSVFRPDTFLSTGNVLGFNAGNPTEGGFNVTDLFGELSLPLISDQPGIDSLDFWAAVRLSDYSNIGSTDSFATALSYAPVSNVKFRVGYQEAVRAPNVFELFNGGNNGFPSATDPCSADGFQAGVTDVATCIASGVPAGQVGVFSQANAQIEGQFGGNENLIEESSDTFTFGVVLEPLEGLDVTLDYFDISIDDAISVFGGGLNNTLDLCFNVERSITSPFCQVVSRRADGNVDTVSVFNANIGALETKGVDLGLNFVTELAGGELAINTKATYLLDYDITPVSGADTVFECSGAFGNTCGSPRTELIVNTRSTWSKGPWSISTLVRYLDSVTNDEVSFGNTPASDLAAPEIGSEVYLDVSASYAFSDDLSVNFGINNILDTTPNAIGNSQEQSNTFPSTYDLLGPRAFLSARYRFR